MAGGKEAGPEKIHPGPKKEAPRPEGKRRRECPVSIDGEKRAEYT